MVRKNWFAANRLSVSWGAPIRVMHLLAPRLLLGAFFGACLAPEESK
jgi:hypothetical protein